jgi:predicted DCC family thiol-disulfide oxidoreductase YuxK
LPERTPLQRYLRVQVGLEAELRVTLRDAAAEAERLILRQGNEIRRDQLRLILREIHRLQRQQWTTISKQTEAGMARAARAAAEAENAINRILFEAAGRSYQDLGAAMRAQAEAGVANLAAKGANNIPLSRQVYRSSAWSNNILDRTIRRGILLGKSAKELAKDVRRFVDPSTPGGATYAANRLARTELNNVFHRTQIDLRSDDPWTTGFKWNLSGSHPRADVCNDLAEKSHYRGGAAGVFRVSEVPGKPHPQCLCFLTTQTVGEDDFVSAMVAGRYDSYIDEKIDRWTP